MNFVTYSEMNRCLYKNLHKIPRDVDLVVGIPRSGMLVASMLGLYLNLPISDLDSILNGHIYSTGQTRKSSRNWIQSLSEAKHILVVDDSISAGDAIKRAQSQISKSKIETKISYLAVYALPTNTKLVDIYFEICMHPRAFEWNYMHHWMLAYACVDIDGVLCEDPSTIENLTEKRYETFLKTATPKLIPTQKIACLVTCRHERYRQQTQAWLSEQGIQYDQLIMLNNDAYTADMSDIEYGQYKGKIYRDSKATFFIESNYTQALEICRISSKQVFCVENQQLISPDSVASHISIARRDFFITFKRVIKKILKKLKMR